MFCDVGALQPLVAAVAGEAGLVVDAAASDHLLGDVHGLACGADRGHGVSRPGASEVTAGHGSGCCGNGGHGWLTDRHGARNVRSSRFPARGNKQNMPGKRCDVNI